MGTVRYTVFDGEILSESRDGIKRDYVPDPLGSTVALLDSTQTKTDTFDYWPYGEESARSGVTQTRLTFLGTVGYYSRPGSRSYVRLRDLDPQLGRWLTCDPVGAARNGPSLYSYCFGSPVVLIDPTGLSPDQASGIRWLRSDIEMPNLDIDIGLLDPARWRVPRCKAIECASCGLALFADWFPRWQHQCNPLYTHCMACCTLTRHVDAKCAYEMQKGQTDFLGGGNKIVNGETVEARRLRSCNHGQNIAGDKRKSCHQHCSDAFPWRDVIHSPHCKDHLKGPNPSPPALPPLATCNNVR